MRGLNTITECVNGQTNLAGPYGNSAWAQLNGSGAIPTTHPQDRTADNYAFRDFAASQFSSALWDVGRIVGP